MSKNKIDGKQTKQGYVSFGYKQLANCEEFKKKLLNLEEKHHLHRHFPQLWVWRADHQQWQHMDAAQVRAPEQV